MECRSSQSAPLCYSNGPQVTKGLLLKSKTLVKTDASVTAFTGSRIGNAYIAFIDNVIAPTRKTSHENENADPQSRRRPRNRRAVARPRRIELHHRRRHADHRDGAPRLPDHDPEGPLPASGHGHQHGRQRDRQQDRLHRARRQRRRRLGDQRQRRPRATWATAP
jgi:hypothetical protein